MASIHLNKNYLDTVVVMVVMIVVGFSNNNNKF